MKKGMKTDAVRAGLVPRGLLSITLMVSGSILPAIFAAANASEAADLSTKAAYSGPIDFLGLPTSKVLAISGGGYWQTFARGNVYQTPKGDVFTVEGGSLSPILSGYLALGGPLGRLGFPIEGAPGAGTSQYPRNGAITALNGLDYDVTDLPITPEESPPAPDALTITSWVTRRSGDKINPGPLVSTVALSWHNKGAAVTYVQRRVNGGAWTTIKSYGALATNTITTFADTVATPGAENCYVVVGSSGTSDREGGYYRASSPVRCVYTRDGRNIKISRAQLRIRVANAYVTGNGWPQTDGWVQVRLQSPASLEQWRPAGNDTWLDSSVDDFEMGSNRAYDLRLYNTTDASDITMITVAVPGNDGLCIAELELLLDDARAFHREYGDASCRWVDSTRPLSIWFHELRNTMDWVNLAHLPTFTGYSRQGLHSKVEGTIGHYLHGRSAYLRDGYPTESTQLSESRMLMAVHFVAKDTDYGNVNCRLQFKLVIDPVYANGVITQTQLKLEEANADSSIGLFPVLEGLLDAALWPALLWIDWEIEKSIGNISGSSFGAPPPNTHFCFPDYEGAGLGLCAGG